MLLRGCLLVLSICLVSVGCGPAPGTAPAANGSTPSQTNAAATSPARAVVAEPPRPTRTFGSIEEAVSALIEASESSDSNTRNDATVYLVQQGPAAVPALAARVSAAETKPRSLIAITRILGQLGPDAVAPLSIVMKHEMPQVRVNAAEQLAIIKPTNEAIVDQLLGLLDHQDPQMQLIAIRGLGHLGKAANKATDRLQALRNSTDHDDALRVAAGEALKKVDPRHTFVD
ncbi:MAG: HEAT repeat domain-containing protein [Planctomycetales bacterium]|nr:HEAT repeat domain-containing protein [Planctomycetales bacterium]